MLKRMRILNSFFLSIMLIFGIVSIALSEEKKIEVQNHELNFFSVKLTFENWTIQ